MATKRWHSLTFSFQGEFETLNWIHGPGWGVKGLEMAYSASFEIEPLSE